MPFLVVVGNSRENANDQAKLIIGDDANILDSGVMEASDFQFDHGPSVSSPIGSFTAGIPGATVWVRWVLYQ